MRDGKGGGQVSGGSYDHLHSRLENLGVAGDISRMADRLRNSGYADAADATMQVLSLPPSLAEVWRAVEWADSGDSDEEDVREAVVAWRADRASRPGAGR